jgi:hypothetical protein
MGLQTGGKKYYKKKSHFLRFTNFKFFFFFFFFYPAFTTLYESEPPHSTRSEITHEDAPQSVGLLRTSDQPVAETST